MKEEKYALCQKVQKMFNCKNLGEDVIAYLWSDVSQMMDCWNAYNKISQYNFHLEIGNFMTLPSWTGSAWLLSLPPNELVYNVDNLDQYNICQSSFHGGLSQCWIPWARANQPEFPDYNPNLPRSEIIDIDMNCLYLSAQRYKMPAGKWELNNYHRELSIEDTNQQAISYEDDLNTNLTLEKKYQQKFSDIKGESPPLPEWIQGNIGFFLECAIWIPPELDDFPPLTVYKMRRKVSKRTSKTWDGSRPAKKLVASLEPIGQYNAETEKWEGIKWYHFLELKNALQLRCKIIGVGQNTLVRTKTCYQSLF